MNMSPRSYIRVSLSILYINDQIQLVSYKLEDDPHQLIKLITVCYLASLFFHYPLCSI